MKIEVTVLSQDMEMLGLVNQMTSLQWTQRFSSVGEFGLWAPLTKENTELLKEDNLIWIGTDEIGVIETVTKNKSSDGELTLEVGGRSRNVGYSKELYGMLIQRRTLSAII